MLMLYYLKPFLASATCARHQHASISAIISALTPTSAPPPAHINKYNASYSLVYYPITIANSKTLYQKQHQRLHFGTGQQPSAAAPAAPPSTPPAPSPVCIYYYKYTDIIIYNTIMFCYLYVILVYLVNIYQILLCVFII